MRKWLVRGLLAGVILFGLIQLVPYGRNHTNPPVTQEIKWDSARTRELAVGACYDCHSNLTKWNIPSYIAPFSWLIYSDVQGGRSSLNFTEWDKPQDSDAQDIVESVNGGMPPWFYKPIHPAARLSSTEKQELVSGLQRTLARDPPKGGGGG